LALDVAEQISAARGKSVAVYSVHTLKPLDREGIRDVLTRFPEVSVLEEHSPHGGLGRRSSSWLGT